jgi:prepilin-type N-terminal cleavage/methylation domain-containing protein
MINRFKGFTLLEVMIAIFVFSTGMLAFMAYHARANAIMFENESAQIAHSVALNMAEDINSMSSQDLRALSQAACFASGGTCQDANIYTYMDRGHSYAYGPYDAWGKPLSGAVTGNYLFYRLILMTSYNDLTQTSNFENTQLGLLRHFDVYAAWPRRETPDVKCSSLGNQFCNYVRIPIVKVISAPCRDNSDCSDPVMTQCDVATGICEAP